MRSFVATALFVAGVTASTTASYLDCANAALEGIDTAKFKDCSNMSADECLCHNKEAVESLSESAEAVCKEAGVDLSTLDSSLCSSSRETAPARHASKPMQPADMLKRAYSPDSEAAMPEPRVVYVTETRTECSCKATPAPAHISQIPVDVPVSSSMMGMLAASSPSCLTAGADPNRFSPFKGAAPQVSAAHGGVAALGVAAVMGLMIAL
ncbi:hypothetical protein N7450_004668 [Penicillium hetheringtonii]|uniref:Extracellular membrane protein CFEM domain-containing protein n=1 Tax=Penicillium hetheringtonii TaxID=911720 RepID=A0AAD6DQM5_9EURO|nr:hypothetical protein N7450_004668 [Penicillium hetheringtonii]